MRKLQELRRLLIVAMEKARQVHRKDGQVWSAGRYDGLKQALQILDQETEKTQRKAAERLMRSVIICVSVTFLSCLASPAFSQSTLHFFVEPLLSKGLGGTAYDLSYDAGGGNTGLSRLEFPVVPLEAGLLIGATIDREGKRQWLFEAGFSHSTFPMSATMNDYDWNGYAGYPPVPWSYTASNDTTVSWSLSMSAAWTFASVGPVSFALCAQYRYQTESHTENTLNGWQYIWNPSEGTSGAWDLYLINDQTTDVLEYTLSAHIPGVGLLVDLQAIKGLDVELRAYYTPVYVSDSDDHKLRTKLSTAAGWGNGVYAQLKATYTLPQLSFGATPYLVFAGDAEYFVVNTTQTQYWYGNGDPQVPQGTTITGVGHVITSTQFDLTLGFGFAF